ncbi:cbb3-type cytochrome oxidase assembly protein CcoS [Saccharicrinis aurantiacus]|uniref:cbb3-type cytochrome oxidase assembly protein CcoS n=1 Tax=Saccharicrinis aurantiacus TaxID=1849719 RepID=UPI00248FE405|nr:cbb3-type cytochrome oxidase assembly protein CcoS [Saccharicrinis aurantiacus]
MNILYLLVGVSLFAALFFLGLFVWAVKSGQYEDTYTPSVRILFDDDNESVSSTEEQKTKTDK